MAANTIGTGALVLSANADGMLAGLDKASKAADRASKDINKKFGGDKGGGGLGAMAGGFLGGFAGAAIGKLLEKPLEKAGNAMLNMVTRAHEFKMELERSGELAEVMAKAMDRSLRRADEKLGAIADPAAMGKAIEGQIAATQRMLATQEQLKAAARDTRNELMDDGDGDSWIAFLGGRLETSLAAADQDFKNASASVSKLNDRMADLQEKSRRLKEPWNDPGLIGGVNQLTESLKLQADTFGMTGTQAQIAALKAKGATEQMLADAQKQADRLDALQKAAQPGKPVQLGGAMQAGSVEAYSLVAKFQAGNTLAESSAKKTEAIAKESRDVLRQILKAVSGADILKVV